MISIGSRGGFGEHPVLGAAVGHFNGSFMIKNERQRWAIGIILAAALVVWPSSPRPVRKPANLPDQTNDEMQVAPS
jgi:hypothetical protein